MAVDLSMVKTDLNFSINISAFPLLSLTSLSFALQWGNTNVVVFPGFYVFPERFGVVGFQPF